LLGSKKKNSHGLCWTMAGRLRDRWLNSKPMITLAVLVPDWRPDVVWKGGAVRTIEGSSYSRPLDALSKFLNGEDSLALSGRFKYERAFGRMLDELQIARDLRGLYRAKTGLRFRVLTTRASATDSAFEITGLD
jgi:hypothetical protein